MTAFVFLSYFYGKQRIKVAVDNIEIKRYHAGNELESTLCPLHIYNRLQGREKN